MRYIHLIEGVNVENVSQCQPVKSQFVVAR